MTISKDRVKPSPLPDSWKLKEIFATGLVLGTYLALMTVIFFWLADQTTFFPHHFNVRDIRGKTEQLTSAVYLQVSIVSQALIFVTRSRSWSYTERPGMLLVAAFVLAQMIATFLAVHSHIKFAGVRGIGWGWAGVIWLYSFIFYIPLDIIEFAVCYILSGKPWDLLLERKVMFTQKKDYGRESREAQWAQAQRTLHGLHSIPDLSSNPDLASLAMEAKHRAEIARLREKHTLKGHVESIVRLKGLDIETIQQSYSV